NLAKPPIRRLRRDIPLRGDRPQLSPQLDQHVAELPGQRDDPLVLRQILDGHVARLGLPISFLPRLFLAFSLPCVASTLPRCLINVGQLPPALFGARIQPLNGGQHPVGPQRAVTTQVIDPLREIVVDSRVIRFRLRLWLHASAPLAHQLPEILSAVVRVLDRHGPSPEFNGSGEMGIRCRYNTRSALAKGTMGLAKAAEARPMRLRAPK